MVIAVLHDLLTVPPAKQGSLAKPLSNSQIERLGIDQDRFKSRELPDSKQTVHGHLGDHDVKSRLVACEKYGF